MKKIGILTFNRAINYGAVLQAYALKTVCNKYGATEIINYKNEMIERAYSLYSSNIIKRFLKKVQFSKKNRKFFDFIDENATEKIYDINNFSSAEETFDKIIVGSDQVWSFYCSGNDKTYLLHGVSDNVKKYSYAASFGAPVLPQWQLPIFKECLSKFEKISVREETGRKILKEQVNIDSSVVLDPTLLLDKEEWSRSLNIRKMKKKYILTYFLDNDIELKEIASAISKKTGLPIYNITTSTKSFFGEKVIKNAGPKEWAEYFYNAEFVVTSSFHGTAFAINFEKQFYTYAKNNRASRIVDLLSSLGIESRRISNADDVDLSKQINYAQVNEKLNGERKKSFEFIESIINE